MMRLRAIPSTRGMSLDEAVAYWTVRYDRGDLSATEEAEFAAWHADPANAEAYAKAGGALAVFDADDGSDPHLRALRQAALDAEPEPSRRRFRFAAAALVAASLAGMVAFTGLDWSGPEPSQPAAVAEAPAPSAQAPRQAAGARTDYATGIGERRAFRLPDGSTVTLNTRSRLTIAFTGDRRLVRLVRGQALFEVAHDRNRPFVVEAADRQVTALGTVFEVRVEPGRMHVLLIEGRVAVDRTSEAAGASSAQVAPVLLRPGQEYVAELGAAQQVAQVDVSRQLLWRDGFVEFDDEPLSRAVAEMNRYTGRPILIANDGTAALRVSGVFRTGSPDRFVSTLSEILPIEARPTPQGQIELSLTGSPQR